MSTINKQSEGAIQVDIDRRCEDWPDIDALIVSGAKETLMKTGFADRAALEISIVLADDSFIQNLNKQYRGKDKPTNVLSFPQELPSVINTGQAACLGDVVMALETIAREAAEQAKPFEHHAAHLVVHGILHLLGFDHENGGDAEKMEQTEIEILGRLGIKNPYEA